MPPEAEDPRAADTRAWFAKAQLDLRCAETDLQAAPPLKGFLTWHDEAFTWTHDLRRLVDACVAIDASLEPALAGAAPLSEFAWRFRYPGEPFEPSLEEAAEALRIARAVVAVTADRLAGVLGLT
jgi:hypothetical protein